MIRALVLADTHVRPGRLDRLPREVLAAARRADVVLHAGDLLCDDVLELLESLAPVHAVRGNNDATVTRALLDESLLEIDGVAVALTHETGASAGRARRVRRRFPDAHVVVFGHSHAPCVEWHDGQLLFNPGSPTERRRAPVRTYGWLELADGRVENAEIVPIG
jgi:putative phosphoesterase